MKTGLGLQTVAAAAAAACIPVLAGFAAVAEASPSDTTTAPSVSQYPNSTTFEESRGSVSHAVKPKVIVFIFSCCLFGGESAKKFKTLCNYLFGE